MVCGVGWLLALLGAAKCLSTSKQYLNPSWKLWFLVCRTTKIQAMSELGKYFFGFWKKWELSNLLLKISDLYWKLMKKVLPCFLLDFVCLKKALFCHILPVFLIHTSRSHTNMQIIKVRKSQKQFFLASILPKNQQNNSHSFCPSL